MSVAEALRVLALGTEELFFTLLSRWNVFSRLRTKFDSPNLMIDASLCPLYHLRSVERHAVMEASILFQPGDTRFDSSHALRVCSRPQVRLPACQVELLQALVRYVLSGDAHPLALHEPCHLRRPNGLVDVGLHVRRQALVKSLLEMSRK